MSLTRLLIRDFRNIETADLALSPGFNFLVGANGSVLDQGIALWFPGPNSFTGEDVLE
ncbi:hypothetical protein ACUOFC_30855, partial [Escherichia sp. TWPC-MK]